MDISEKRHNFVHMVILLAQSRRRLEYFPTDELEKSILSDRVVFLYLVG